MGNRSILRNYGAVSGQTRGWGEFQLPRKVLNLIRGRQRGSPKIIFSLEGYVRLEGAAAQGIFVGPCLGEQSARPMGRDSHTKRYGQSRGKTHGMGNPSCAEAQCLHSKESVLHVSFPFLYLLHLSLSLGALAIGVWSTMAEGTINLPDDLLSSKAPEEHWTDKGIFRDLNSYVPFLWALFP